MNQQSQEQATPHGDLLRSLTSTDQADLDSKNSSKPKEELIERHQVENTAFTIIGQKIEGTESKAWFIALGKYRLTTNKPTRELCKELIDKKDWELILGLIHATCAFREDMEKQHRGTDGQIITDGKGPLKGNYPISKNKFNLKERITNKKANTKNR